MLSRPPQQLLEAIKGLQSNTHFQRVVDWLRESLAETRKQNDVLEGILLTRSQGHAVMLSEIIDIVDEVDAHYSRGLLSDGDAGSAAFT